MSNEKSRQMLCDLGYTYRGDWSSFDGRVFQHQVHAIGECIVGNEKAKDALDTLGEYYRNDWSTVDGRTVSKELEYIANMLD